MRCNSTNEITSKLSLNLASWAPHGFIRNKIFKDSSKTSFKSFLNKYRGIRGIRHQLIYSDWVKLGDHSWAKGVKGWPQAIYCVQHYVYIYTQCFTSNPVLLNLINKRMTHEIHVSLNEIIIVHEGCHVVNLCFLNIYFFSVFCYS